MIAQLTWNIDRQNTIQNIRHQAQRRLRRRRSGPHRSEIHQRALAQNANRVQNEKRVVAQPGEDARRHAGQRERKVGVADDLGDGPGDEHGAVGGRLDGEVRVEEEDAPDEEEARGDLHERREEGRADDSWCFVDVSVGDANQKMMTVGLPKRECRISMAAAVCVHLVNSPTFR